MNIRVVGHLCWLALVMLLCATAAGAQGLTAEADGVRAYLGVVPAEMARASLTPHLGPARDEHGRPIGSGAEHHVVLALFDSASGARIENAEVSATLIAHGKTTSGKPLEPMRINDTVTYGAVFEFASGAEHHLKVEIRIPGRAQPIALAFNYQEPHGSTR